MAKVETLIAAEPTARLNVADRLTAAAKANPNQLAVVCPRHLWSRYFSRNKRTCVSRATRAAAGPQRRSGTTYETITFADLDADVSCIARGLADWGVPPGTRLALLVRPGIDFVALVFALLRAGMVIVMVDPGMGRRNLIRCLAEANPGGFVAIGAGQGVRSILRRRFSKARWNVTVGRRWFWGGKTLDQLRTEAPNPQSDIRHPKSIDTRPDDPAAIIFTSGSTGAPKGVLYTHRMFDTQVAEIQAQYDIEPGGIDLACFPLFALFNAAMGVTTVLPDMNFSRPAAANPAKLLNAANDWQVTQAFASPAVWRLLSAHCAKTGERIGSLRQVFSCGAPVPADVIRATLACVATKAKMHTPYGATECLPVSTIEAAEILREIAERTDHGAGVCVGRKFGSIEWRVIRITDEPIASIAESEELPANEIGELIVRGPQVSSMYVTGTTANKVSKIDAGSTGYSVLDSQHAIVGTDCGAPSSPCFWHRTGDVGYIDDDARFWYCGRKSQRVQTENGTLFTECVEAIFNSHPHVARAALVGVGPRGHQMPAIVYEPVVGEFNGNLREFAARHESTKEINLFHSRQSLPVDVRHNAKINREELAEWVARRIKR